MKLTLAFLAAVLCASGARGQNVTTFPGPLQIVTLDVKTVTTGGAAVTAIANGHRTAGGFIQNPTGAVALCINEIGTATGATSSGDTTCIAGGATYTVAPSIGSVSVISSDSSHPFSGYGFVR
jgi:hypothetical protein